MLALWQQYKYIDELIPRCSLTTPSKHGLAKQWTLQNNNHLLEMFDGIEFMCIRRNEAFQSNSRRIQEFANLEGFLTSPNPLRCTKTRKGLRHFFQTLPPAGRDDFLPTNVNIIRIVYGDMYLVHVYLSSIALYNIITLE